jgi:tripartite tricarboxylate transporter family receptor
MNSDFDDEEGELAWMTKLAKDTGRPVWFLLTDRYEDPARWRRLLTAVHAARKDGAPLTAQIAGRPIGVMMGIGTALNPFTVRPSYRRFENLSIAEQRARLRDPEVRRQILADKPSEAEVAKLAQFRQLIVKRWDKFSTMGDPPDYEPGEEKSVAAIAAREGRTPDEVAYDYITEAENRYLFGVGRVTRAAPDGYTLSLGSASSHVRAIYALAYDLMKDLQPVSVLVLEPQMFIAKRTMPANDLGSLIVWLKANPDKALLGTQGVGNMGAGQIDMMIDSPATAVPMARAGAIKAYAVSGTHRLLNAPNIPTADEAGLSGFYASNWRGLWAPKGTPKDIIAKLDLAVVDALADPVVRSRFDGLGLEIAPRQPRDLR